MDRECYRAKVDALVQIQVKPLEEKGEKPLRVSQAPSWQTKGHAKDVLFEGQYRKAKAKGECPNTKAAVLIDGKGAGSIFYLCQAEKCDVHNRVTRYQPTPQEQAQRKKEALAERVEKLSRVRILEAIRKKLPDVLSRPDLEMVALDYFRRLGHDNHRRLSKLHSWEEKKSKASWGGQTVDYEKIATAAVHVMKAADTRRVRDGPLLIIRVKRLVSRRDDLIRCPMISAVELHLFRRQPQIRTLGSRTRFDYVGEDFQGSSLARGAVEAVRPMNVSQDAGGSGISLR